MAFELPFWLLQSWYFMSLYKNICFPKAWTASLLQFGKSKLFLITMLQIRDWKCQKSLHCKEKPDRFFDILMTKVLWNLMHYLKGIFFCDKGFKIFNCKNKKVWPSRCDCRDFLIRDGLHKIRCLPEHLSQKVQNTPGESNDQRFKQNCTPKPNEQVFTSILITKNNTLQGN